MNFCIFKKKSFSFIFLNFGFEKTVLLHRQNFLKKINKNTNYEKKELKKFLKLNLKKKLKKLI